MKVRQAQNKSCADKMHADTNRVRASSTAEMQKPTLVQWAAEEPNMHVHITDGGRTEAGYRGKTGDCVVRAIATAMGRDYQSVYDDINALADRERPRGRKKRSNARTGVHKATIRRYMESTGWRWTPTMSIGSGCKVHLRSDELPAGRLVVSVSRHLVAVIDGTIHDNHDCSRGGTRCVYGYWSEA